MGCGSSKDQPKPKSTESAPNSTKSTESGNIFNSAAKLVDVYNLDNKTLGEGSYGTVCKATRKGTDSSQTFAVKSIVKDKSEKNKLRTHQEIEIMKSMTHPNIITVFDAFQDAKKFYIVMDLCSGGELFDHIVLSGHFSEASAGIIMKQIIGALKYMHDEKSIAHRDLKPENFLLLNKDNIDSQTNLLKIIDFGLSCHFEPGKALTTKAGTPYYVAPEVLAGSYDEKSDLWSCGVIMFVLHCGYPPFYGDTDAEVLTKVKSGTFKFDYKDWSKISENCKKLISAMLTKDPKKRLSAKGALQHDWFKDCVKLTAGLDKSIFKNLNQTQATNKLKKWALTQIASGLGSEKIKELQAAFKKLDTDDDNHLSHEELKKGLTEAGISQPDIDKIWSMMDTDQSKKIEYTEFLVATIEARIQMEESVLWDAFGKFDENGDGQISRKELEKVGQKLEGDANISMYDKNALDALIASADSDGDGFISFDEFKVAVTGKK